MTSNTTDVIVNFLIAFLRTDISLTCTVITTSISAIGVTRIGFGGNTFPFLVSEFVDFLVFLVFPFAFTRSTTFAQQFLFGRTLFSVEQRAFWTSE